MDPHDPVDAAELHMMRETYAYLAARESGQETDPEPMKAATAAYGEALETWLTNRKLNDQEDR